MHLKGRRWRRFQNHNTLLSPDEIASSEQAALLVGFGTRDRQSLFWDDNSSELKIRKPFLILNQFWSATNHT